MDYSFTQARGSLMLVENVAGVRIPRALNTLLAGIGPVGGAFAMMLPLVGVVAAVAIVEKLIAKHKEMAEETAAIGQAENNLGATIENVFNSLDEKLLRAGIKSDELRGDHLAAVKKELQLIDMQSMGEIAHEFDVLGKAADAVFTQLKAHWYEWGDGSDHAKASLKQFQSQYELLLATKKPGDANKLLNDEIAAEQHILDLQKDAQDYYNATKAGKAGDLAKYTTAITELNTQGLGFSAKEVESQKDLLDILNAQLRVRAEVNTTAGVEKGNVGAEESKRQTEEHRKMIEAIVADDKRLADEQTKVLEGEAKENEAFYRNVESQLKKSEEEKTKIIRESFIDKANAEREAADGDLKIAIEGAKEEEKLALQHAKSLFAIHQIGAWDLRDAEIKASQEATTAELQAVDIDIKNLNKGDERYLTELQKFENKKKQIVAKGAADVTAINKIADDAAVTEIRNAQTKMEESISSNIAKSIVANKSLAQSFRQMGEQMAETMLANLIMAELFHQKHKLIDAKGAYTGVLHTDVESGMPHILAEVDAISAFAGVMAMEQGGKIPGDSGAVPIIGHAGEYVIDRSLTQKLESNTSQSQNHTFNFAPVVHAIDTEGVDNMLKKHAVVFQRHVASTMRRMHRS
jgi:hypothetical protein